MELVNKKEFVSIMDSNSNKTIYPIRKSILDRVDENNLSEWIIQLSGKKWVTTEILYQLALVIIEEFPDNAIDWEASFFGVEKKRIINEAVDLDDSVKGSEFDQALKMMELGKQFIDDGTDDKIKQYVSEQLKLHGIK